MLFTKTEYKERLIKVQTEMQKKGNRFVDLKRSCKHELFKRI